MSAGNEHVLHLLQLAAHRLRTYSDRRGIEVAGVTSAQAGALFVIADNPGAAQREIAQALKQQESAVNSMVARLLEAGLVERNNNPSDKRAWALYLTPKGKKSLKAIQSVLNEINERIDDALGEEGIHDLALSLQSIMNMKL